jgi:transposase
MEVVMDRVWVGIDVGKEFHWAHALDASGRELLSRKLENGEADVSKLIDEALCLAEEVLWTVDQPGGSAALLLGLLWERDQRVLYIPGLSVNRASDAYRGESKTDARDARVIAYPKPGCAQTSASLKQVSKRSPSCSSCSLAAETSSSTKAGLSLA